MFTIYMIYTRILSNNSKYYGAGPSGTRICNDFPGGEL